MIFLSCIKHCTCLRQIIVTPPVINWYFLRKYHSYYMYVIAISSIHSWWRHHMETFSALLTFLRGIHRSPVYSPRKGQWRGALMFSLICVWTNNWANIWDAGDWSSRFRSSATRMFIEQFIRTNVNEISKSALLALCEWNPPVTGGFPSLRANTWCHHEMPTREICCIIHSLSPPEIPRKFL